MRKQMLLTGLLLTVLALVPNVNAVPSLGLRVNGGIYNLTDDDFTLGKNSIGRTKIVAQNSFSLSLDANSAAGDQGVASINVSPDQIVSIQVFGSRIQNATGFGIRFEYDASQVLYEGFDAGSVLPGSPQVLAEHGTNPTSVRLGIASFGSQATVSSGLVGTIRFRTTTGFSGTAIQLVSAELSRSGQSETVTLTARVELGVSTAPSPDFDGDGTVGISDFLLFVNHFGTSRGSAGYDAEYDLDGNDAIGISDFLIFVDSFGKEVPPSGGGGGGGSGSPDLIVTSPSVSNNTLTTGQSFTLRATVRNQGAGPSTATTLRYYRSSDATISTSDTEVGTDSVSGLSASGTSAESISLNAPSSAGTYYYGACVESVTGERNTDNNCSDGMSVTVSALTSSELLIAPGETKGYSKTFSANFSFAAGAYELAYRVRSSTVDDGLSGLSDVKIRWVGGRNIFGETLVDRITCSYDIHVSSTVPLNTTLRATIVYDVGTKFRHGSPPVGYLDVKETYTVSLVILVRDSGSNGGSSGGGGGATVTIPDARLRAVIADNLGKASGAPITPAEMASLTRIDAPNKGIRSLTGLEQAINLQWLDLGLGRASSNSNAISDLSPLSNLTNLTYLDLTDNSITDISTLSNLTNLTRLNLRRNRISDISVLSNLTNLTGLYLHANRGNFSISVLSNLTNLTELSLGHNGISDISVLSNLTNLTELSLGGNSISNISVLSNLTNLIVLNLWGNSISDISVLSNLTNLTVLRLQDNNISDISPLVANTGLGSRDAVNVKSNPLSSVSINTHIPALQSRGVTVEFD